MESWMIIVLIIGAIIMATVWMLRIVGDRELKNRERMKHYNPETDLSPPSSDDLDDNARYDSNGRRIN